MVPISFITACLPGRQAAVAFARRKKKKRYPPRRTQRRQAAKPPEVKPSALQFLCVSAPLREKRIRRGGPAILRDRHPAPPFKSLSRCISGGSCPNSGLAPCLPPLDLQNSIILRTAIVINNEGGLGGD